MLLLSKKFEFPESSDQGLVKVGVAGGWQSDREVTAGAAEANAEANVNDQCKEVQVLAGGNK